MSAYVWVRRFAAILAPRHGLQALFTTSDERQRLWSMIVVYYNIKYLPQALRYDTTSCDTCFSHIATICRKLLYLCAALLTVHFLLATQCHIPQHVFIIALVAVSGQPLYQCYNPSPAALLVWPIVIICINLIDNAWSGSDGATHSWSNTRRLDVSSLRQAPSPPSWNI